jgi:hypothetical protein
MAMADDAETPFTGYNRPSRQKWIGAAIAVVFVAIQFTLQQLPYAGITEWSFFALCGVAGAVALFWARHERPWFWPAVFAIAALDIGLILLQSRVGLATDLGKGAMGVAMLFAAVASLLLFWMHWLFDPHATPRTAASRAVEIVIYGFVIACLALIAFVYRGVQRSSREDPHMWQVVLTRESPLPMRQLLECLAPNGEHRHAWEELDTVQPTRRGYDFGRGVQTVVIDLGPQRRLTFATRRARPLTALERSNAEECLVVGQ